MKGKILIIEDDPAITMALRDRLQNEGYGVECVSDGVEGFDRSINVGWDLIILDIMLPGKDGLEVCRDIRAKGVNTPILMLTARDETVDKVVGLKMGAGAESGKGERAIRTRSAPSISIPAGGS
jgi:DNA-binding response OmpR family regulator